MFNNYRRRTAARIKILKSTNRVLMLYSIIVTIFAFAICCIYIDKVNDDNEEKINYEAQISTQQNYLSWYIDNLSNHNKECEELKITINELIKIESELDQQNRSLVASNEEYFEELEEFRSREELYDRYQYALYFGGQRNDITFDQLRTLEECVKESSIPDQDLILSWIMCESHGFTNAKNPCSSAKGYGQFLDGTSKFVYTNLLGEKDWTPSVAYDGETSMRMMVAYTDYLYDHYGGARGMLKGYTGSSDPSFLSSYESKLNRYLRFSGKTFADMYEY